MQVLITGASSGLGYELAKLFDDNGSTLILVARNQVALEQLCQELKTMPTLLIGDLTQEDFLNEVMHYIKEHPIDILINNAGIGAYGYFKDISMEQEKNLILLNILALHSLMKAFIQSKETGRIINISSIAACQVDPLMATYGATKSYVWMLSKSVQVELRKQHSNIQVQVCLPGSFNSSFDQNANISSPLKGASGQKVAKEIMKGIKKNKQVILPIFSNKYAYYLSKLIPERALMEIEFYLQNKKGK